MPVDASGPRRRRWPRYALVLRSEQDGHRLARVDGGADEVQKLVVSDTTGATASSAPRSVSTGRCGPPPAGPVLRSMCAGWARAGAWVRPVAEAVHAAAESVQGYADMPVFVGADPDDDIIPVTCDAVHGLLISSLDRWSGTRNGRADRTARGPDAIRLL